MSVCLLQKKWFRIFKLGHQMASTYVGGTGPGSEVIIESISDKAIITLNRPKTLNALNMSMIRTITASMKEWHSKDYLKMIIIKGAGDKAFCAGGDIRDLVEKDIEIQKRFFREEYFLNHAIGTSKIPWVAFIDGITLGGGVGLSVHGDFRVATERTLFAMPETAIGLIPDVGGGHFLPRLGTLGTFLALTGFRLKGRDVVTVGIATHFIESSKMADLEKELILLESPNKKDIKEVLDHYNKKSLLHSAKSFILSDQKYLIDDIFSSYDLEDIFERLQDIDTPFSTAVLGILNKMSPTSLKLTLEQMKRGKNMDLKEVLEMEYGIVSRIVEGNEFHEGVRALLIDKDLKPNWNPSSIKNVRKNYISRYFEKLSECEQFVL